MADTILSGRWVINYETENRQKRIWRNTSVSPTTLDSVNALYSALQNHFDELSQMDDGVPMSAQTPTEYTIGIIDAGDKDPWFIDRTSVEYLTGGALKTASWDRVEGTNTGIVRMAYTTGTDFDTTDIGRDILMTIDGDRGTILDFNTTGSTKYVWIRPDDNAAGNSFNDAPTANGAFTVPNDSISSVKQVVASGPTYVDETVDANSAGASDWTIFPAGALADYALIGYSQKFKKLVMNVGTAGAGTYTVTWQYWNGAWTNLSTAGTVTDSTNSFKTSGTNNVTFTAPTDWVSTSFDGSQQLYWIRALKDTGTVTTPPLGTQGFIGGTGAANQAGGAAVSSGESLWANIYSIGTLEDYSHLYIYQNGTYLNAYKGTSDWWGDKTTGQVIPGTSTLTDHIDILVNVKELGLETDEGYVQVFARQYSKTYSYYSVDLTSGGRNPIPLQTGNDLDNQTGWKTFTITNSSGVSDFDAGNYIYVGASWTTATKRGKLTVVGGTITNPVLTYYLIGEPITDFAVSDAVKEYTGTADGDGTCTVSDAPTNAGPALGEATYAWSVTHAANETFDIDENGSTENYSIVINCDSRALTEVYEWSKWITRRGETALDSYTDGINGEAYIGSDYRIIYTTLNNGPLAEGTTVTGLTSGAKGTVVAHNTTDKILILRNSRGTFQNAETIDDDGSSATVTGTTVSTISPITAAPYGTFAGGKWFCAPGVVLNNVLSADLNNYQLVTDNGAVVVAPTKVTLTVSNTRLGDKVGVFRLTAAGGTIKKTYTVDTSGAYNATIQSAGVGTAIMGSAIRADEPGIAAGGIIRLVDTSANNEYRIRFSSWSASTFTLHNYTFTTLTGSTNSTTIATSSTEFTNAKVGDLVYNSTRLAYSYIISIAGDNLSATISPAITNQASTDTIKLNVLPVATTTSPQDSWYVPLIDTYETTGSTGTPGTETATITYLADIPVRVRARHADTAVNGGIVPYEADSTVTNTGMSNSIIRTSDTIFT